MIQHQDLTPAFLSRAQRNGGSTTIRQGEVSAAIRLGVFGLGTISKGEPQTVTLTAQGRAAHHHSNQWI